MNVNYICFEIVTRLSFFEKLFFYKMSIKKPFFRLDTGGGLFFEKIRKKLKKKLGIKYFSLILFSKKS